MNSSPTFSEQSNVTCNVEQHIFNLLQNKIQNELLVIIVHNYIASCTLQVLSRDECLTWKHLKCIKKRTLTAEFIVVELGD